MRLRSARQVPLAIDDRYWLAQEVWFPRRASHTACTVCSPCSTARHKERQTSAYPVEQASTDHPMLPCTGAPFNANKNGLFGGAKRRQTPAIMPSSCRSTSKCVNNTGLSFPRMGFVPCSSTLCLLLILWIPELDETLNIVFAYEYLPALTLSNTSQTILGYPCVDRVGVESIPRTDGSD